MVAGYSVLSFHLPVQDRLTEMSLGAILTKVFVYSIGPYWFLQTMIVCGIVYYTCFRLLRGHIEPVSVLFVLSFSLIILAEHSPSLSVKAMPYYLLGAALRQSRVSFNAFFKKSPFAILPIIALLLHDEMRDWGSIATPAVAYSLISFLSWLNSHVCRRGLYQPLLFIGANTLPVYLFHPIFTMLAKYYQPLFEFDSTRTVHALATVILAVTGSMLIAHIMDRTQLSILFGSKRILNKLQSQTHWLHI